MVAGVWGCWSHCFYSEQAESNECRHSARSLVFISSRTSAHEKCSPRHTQKCVSMVIPSPGKLIRLAITKTGKWTLVQFLSFQKRPCIEGLITRVWCWPRNFQEVPYFRHWFHRVSARITGTLALDLTFTRVLRVCAQVLKQMHWPTEPSLRPLLISWLLRHCVRGGGLKPHRHTLMPFPVGSDLFLQSFLALLR